MNINIKNCEVNIITGTDTLEINGGTQPAAAEAPAAQEGSGSRCRARPQGTQTGRQRAGEGRGGAAVRP